MSEHYDLTSHFMGAATVGERGQVVIPAEARERLDIKPGDKLLVFVHPAGWGVAFVRFDKLQQAKLELEQAIAATEHLAATDDAGAVAQEEQA
jgi:AbrB family looped-hinge helix DNA binding protein